MEVKKRQPIGIELVKRGVVSENDIEQAIRYQRTHPDVKIGEALYRLKVCDSEELVKAVGEIIGGKGILLKPQDVKINFSEYISPEMAQKNKVIPFAVESGRIKVCFADMNDTKTIETIRLLMLNKGLLMETYVTFETVIDEVLEELNTVKQISNTSIDLINQDEPMTKLLDEIIRKAMEKRASDIHIEPLETEIRIRCRIDGELITTARLPKDRQSQIIGRLKAISNMHQEKQESQDGRILLYNDYNIRVSSQKNIYGEKFVLRLLKKSAKIRDIFELGYPGDEHTLSRSVNKRNSITVVAAPTGEGKTTTLYSIIDKLNSPEVNITTIEDPVEIRIPGLNQIEIDTKSTFSGSLRTVLRQDPDIILVGEIRDRETAEIAMQAGQTGHYVLSTIHTIDAIEVITRLRKIGISNYDIASTLATSMSQRLVRRLCPHCKRERDFTEEEKQIIKNIGEKYGENFELENAKTFNAVGCEYCNKTGFYERIGIFEVLDLTDEVKELIMRDASSIEIRRKALEGSYRPLVIDGLRKVLNGTTNLEELNRKILIF